MNKKNSLTNGGTAIIYMVAGAHKRKVCSAAHAADAGRLPDME